MCGIIGYIGKKKATPILINGLLRLEYRGYDSAGIATVESDKIAIMKDKGRVKNLENLKGINDLNGTIGIAHTRWATHGKTSKENAHPHYDNNKTFAVVHNGIIENYHDLKEFLIKKGYTFYSETDTEVIPNLIHYYYTKDDNHDNLQVLRAVHKACMDLQGSFGLQIISTFMPDNLIVVRKDSPLVIGKGNGENYVSSDIPAILSFTKDFYLLNDYEFAVLSRDKIDFYGSTYIEIPSDKYLSSYRKNNGEYMFNGQWLPFYFKFSENEFLRISVGSNHCGSSLGEKMAALSDFYSILSEEYGEPTVFYTTKDDDEGLLTLQWAFINKEEEIEKFQSGTYFDDAEIDTLIVLGKKRENVDGYSLSDKTRKIISRQVGLPFELIYLVDEDIENFVKHKNGKEVTIPTGAKVDGYPVTSYEKKLERKLRKI